MCTLPYIKWGGGRGGSFLMFHLCLLKYMIKLFFLSSFLFLLASLIMENYTLAVNIQTFLKDTPAFIVFGFDLQAYRQKRPFQALGNGIKIPSVAVSLPDFTF